MEDKYVEEEISLKELIMHLIHYKRIIAIITVLAVVLGGIYAFFIADEVYEASVDGTIIISETATSKYGTFVFPSLHKEDYLNVITSEEVLTKVVNNLNLEMSTQALRQKIEISSQKDSSSFIINVKNGSSESASELLSEISSVYKDVINLKYKNMALDMFERDYFVQIRSIEELIINQEETIVGFKKQLESIEPIITLKKLVTSDPTLAAEIARNRGISIESLSDEMMIEEISNPNYEVLEESIFKAESALIESKSDLEQFTKLFNELSTEKASMQTSGNETGSVGNNSLEFMKSRISISSYVSAPDNPVAPRKSLILAISMVLGLIVGIFIALFKAYWHNN